MSAALCFGHWRVHPITVTRFYDVTSRGISGNDTRPLHAAQWGFRLQLRILFYIGCLHYISTSMTNSIIIQCLSLPWSEEPHTCTYSVTHIISVLLSVRRYQREQTNPWPPIINTPTRCRPLSNMVGLITVTSYMSHAMIYLALML